MSRVGLEPTTPVSGLAKRVHASDSVATVIGTTKSSVIKLFCYLRALDVLRSLSCIHVFWKTSLSYLGAQYFRLTESVATKISE
jgi:hypothetical protein